MQALDPKYINYAISFIFDGWNEQTFERLQEGNLDREWDQLNIVYESADEAYIYEQVLELANKFKACEEGVIP